jgi:hypothetical protein
MFARNALSGFSNCHLLNNAQWLDGCDLACSQQYHSRGPCLEFSLLQDVTKYQRINFDPAVPDIPG